MYNEKGDEVTVYIDLFFLVNFISDFFILLSAQRIRGVRISVSRTLLGAFIGAFPLCFLFLFPVLQNSVFKILIFILMDLSVFGFKNFLQNTLCLFMCFFISGGVFYSLSVMMGNKKLYILLTSLIIALLVCFFVSKRIKITKAKSFLKVTIYKDGEKHLLNALFDSGNLSVDKRSGLPMIICENIFGDLRLKKTKFKTASGYGDIGVFLPDFIKIEYDGEVFFGKNVALGVIEGKLSSDNSFNALVGGICFDGLSKEIKGAAWENNGRGNFLYRGSPASSTSSYGERGDGTFGKTFRG